MINSHRLDCLKISFVLHVSRKLPALECKHTMCEFILRHREKECVLYMCTGNEDNCARITNFFHFTFIFIFMAYLAIQLLCKSMSRFLTLAQ